MLIFCFHMCKLVFLTLLGFWNIVQNSYLTRTQPMPESRANYKASSISSFQFVINRASFRPLFLSTSDRDLFTFTKGVKNYNSSVLLQFRGGIRPARRHPRWCAQSIPRRHRWQGHHPRCHQQGEFTFACGFGLIVAFANSVGEQRSALWGGDKVQGPAVQGKQDMCCIYVLLRKKIWNTDSL